MRILLVTGLLLSCTVLMSAKLPILLIPGIGGSILVDVQGEDNPAWVGGFKIRPKSSQPNAWCWSMTSYFELCFHGGHQSHEQLMNARFNHTTHMMDPVFDKGAKIVPLVKELCGIRNGFDSIEHELCGIEYLFVATGEGWWQTVQQELAKRVMGPYVSYYRPMTEHLKSRYGLKAGEDVFGFPYDWRLSSQTNAHMLAKKIEAICSTRKQPINIVAHSMGNSVMMAFLANYNELAKKCVANWVAVAAPFQGAGGEVIDSPIQGHNFGNHLVCDCATRPLAVQSPAVMELLPDPNFPWQARVGKPQNPYVRYFSEDGAHTIDTLDGIHGFFSDVFSNFDYCVGSKRERFSLNDKAWQKAAEFWQTIRPKLRRAHETKLFIPPMHVAFGYGTPTTYGVTYEGKIQKPAELLKRCGGNNCEQACSWPLNCSNHCGAKYDLADGDGTVLTVSANTPVVDQSFVKNKKGFAKAGHLEIIKTPEVIDTIFKEWLGY